MLVLEGPSPNSGFVVQDIEWGEGKEESGDREAFLKKLISEIDGVLLDREVYEQEWKKAVKQYKARLEREDAKAGESKLDFTTTREICGQARARLINPILSYDTIMVAKARSDEFKAVRKSYEDYADYLLDIEKTRRFLDMAVQQSQVFPKAVAKVTYRWEERKVYFWQKYQDPVKDELGNFMPQLDPFGEAVVDEEDNPVPIMESGIRVSEKIVEENAGPHMEVLNSPDFIHPFPIPNIEEAPWVVHRFWEHQSRTEALIKKGIYKKADDEDSIRAGSATSKSDQKGPDPGFSLGSYRSDSKKEKKNDKGASALKERWEIYTTDKNDREVILTWAVDEGRLLRDVYNWHFEYPRPFATFCWEEVLNDIDGTSLCSILHSLHKAYSASLNQRLDSASKSLEKIILAFQDSGLDEFFVNGELRGGFAETSFTPEEMTAIREFNLASPFTQLETLEQIFKSHMHDVSGIAAPFFGEEVASRPTASGTLQVIEEAKQPTFMRLESFREFIIKIVNMLMARASQYYPDGTNYYVETLPPDQRAMTDKLMEDRRAYFEASEVEERMFSPPVGAYWQDQVYFETRVSSQTMSRSVRKQEVLAIVDKVPQLTDQILQLAGLASSGQPVSIAAAKILRLQTQIILNFFEEFDIGGGELIDVTDDIPTMEAIQETITGLQQQLEMALQQQASLEAQLKDAGIPVAGAAPVGQGAPPQAAGPGGV